MNGDDMDKKKKPSTDGSSSTSLIVRPPAPPTRRRSPPMLVDIMPDSIEEGQPIPIFDIQNHISNSHHFRFRVRERSGRRGMAFFSESLGRSTLHHNSEVHGGLLAKYIDEQGSKHFWAFRPPLEEEEGKKKRVCIMTSYFAESFLREKEHEMRSKILKQLVKLSELVRIELKFIPTFISCLIQEKDNCETLLSSAGGLDLEALDIIQDTLSLHETYDVTKLKGVANVKYMGEPEDWILSMSEVPGAKDIVEHMRRLRGGSESY